MAKYCSNCGLEALEGSKFCKNCGKPIIQVVSLDHDEAKFNEEKTHSRDITIKKETAQINKDTAKGNNTVEAVEHKYRATVGRGSMMFSQGLNINDSLSFQDTSAIFYTLGKFRNLLTGFKSFFKNPRSIITIVILVISWIGLLLVEVSEDQTPITELLSYLTFAKGGFQTNTLGFIGGTFGKAILAGGAISLVNGLFTRSLFKNFGSGIKSYFSSFRINGFGGIALMGWGAGFGLIGYNFFTGNLSPEYSMIGIVAILMVIMSITSSSGFIYGFIAAIMTKAKKKSGQKYISRYANPSVIKNGLAGITLGTAFGLFISGAGNEYAGYAIGLMILGLALLFSVIALAMGGRHGA